MKLDHQQWWRSAVIYQIYIRSFADGNADGIGDIAGIRSRLGYLAALGVDALWITPWFPSPMADGGYDVADYRSIAPEFGTLAEAEALVQEAHRHGLRIILDIVPNHTSDQHPWFQQALAAAPGSVERQRYHFRDHGAGPPETPPNDWQSVFGGPAWSKVDDQWYLHLFAPEQPDLNWNNPEVRAEFEDILRFWFDRGVDGMRIDVAQGLTKDPDYTNLGITGHGLLRNPDIANHPHFDRDDVHEVYRQWRLIADSYPEPKVFVGEIWINDRPERLARYVRPGELHSAFNFDFLTAPWQPRVLRRVIDRSIAAMSEVGAPSTWVLSNHDLPRVVTRYGRTRDTAHEAEDPGPTDIELGRRRARAAALLMLALPGGAYIYQGDELGLPEVEDLPESVLTDPIWERSGHTERGRDGCRVPLPWSDATRSLGFGANGSWLPQPADWVNLTAQVQQAEPNSMLRLYREALRIRRAESALGDGTLAWHPATPPDVLGFDRKGTNGTVGCLVNFGSDPVPLPEHTEILLSSQPLEPGAALLTDTAVWLRF